jgi:hypothetical protein
MKYKMRRAVRKGRCINQHPSILYEREFKTSSQFIMRQMLPYASLLLLPLPPSFSLPFLAMALLTALL